MIIKDFKPFHGKSCEPTTVGNLLQQCGLTLSEPMIFGIGEGLNFIFWDSKQMGYPFLGGRCKQDVFTENVARNLQLKLEVKETSSRARSWEFVKSNLDKGIPVGLKLDFYYLDYVELKIHFAAHYVTIYGYDEEFGFLIDGEMQTKSSLTSIAEARNYKGSMSSPNRAFTITADGQMPDIKNTVAHAIQKNAEQYLNPPIQNISFKGIRKTANLITRWLEKPGMIPQLIVQTGSLMEEAGTGGALFRNMYRDFLQECDGLYPEMGLHDSYLEFLKIAPLWTEVSRLICEAGNHASSQPLKEASGILLDIASLEERAMRLLFENTSSFLEHKS